MIIFPIFTLKLVTVTNFSFGLINARLERYLLYEKHKDELEQKKLNHQKKINCIYFHRLFYFLIENHQKKLNQLSQQV